IFPTPNENNIRLRHNDFLSSLESKNWADNDQAENLEHQTVSKTVISEQLVVKKNNRKIILVENYKIENVDDKENYIIFKEVKYTIKEFCEYPYEVNNRFRIEVKDMLNMVQKLQKDIEELENFI
ncbi:18731_t:CDS:2, partial [Racocetra persica]